MRFKAIAVFAKKEKKVPFACKRVFLRFKRISQ